MSVLALFISALAGVMSAAGLLFLTNRTLNGGVGVRSVGCGVAVVPVAALFCVQEVVVGMTTDSLPLAIHSSVLVFKGWQYSTLLACFLPVTLFCCLLITKPARGTQQAVSGLAVLVSVGTVFVCANTLVWWLLSFELLLLVSLYLLRLTSKSERIGDAVADMFFWTLTGSVGLLLAFVQLALSGFMTVEDLFTHGGVSGFVGFLLLVGFGVKLPLWPCFSWLLKAHVEASVEFSILLSGVVVKFGALGLYRVMQLQTTALCAVILLSCGTLAIIEATLRLLAQRDLKRIVALTTVIEMNWLAVCLGFGGSLFEDIGAFLLVAHSLTTAGEFYGVECLYRRYQSRDVTTLSGVAYAAPLLFACLFLTTLVTIGFPPSSLFIAKVWFFLGLAQLSSGVCLFYLVWFVLLLPVVFFRIWVPVWFGQPSAGVVVCDLSSRELGVLTTTLIGGLVLGVAPGFVLDGAC